MNKLYIAQKKKKKKRYAVGLSPMGSTLEQNKRKERQRVNSVPQYSTVKDCGWENRRMKNEKGKALPAK